MSRSVAVMVIALNRVGGRVTADPHNARSATQPGKGCAEKAAQWRAKLDETSKSQDVETPK